MTLGIFLFSYAFIDQLINDLVHKVYFKGVISYLNCIPNHNLKNFSANFK